MAQEPAPIRVTTRLVQVTLVAHDRDGQPVEDLTREDFTLTDGGRVQQVRVFSIEKSATRRLQPPALPANNFTNRLEQRRDLPNAVTAILFDQINTSVLDQHQAKQKLIAFLSGIEPSQRIALYALGRDLRVLHDFSTDAGSLVRRLKAHQARLGHELDASRPQPPPETGDEELDAWLGETEKLMADFQMHLRVRTTLNALESLAHHLGKLSGRKNLMWISGSFPMALTLKEFVERMGSARGWMRPSSYGPELQRCARLFNQGSIAVYPVHARALVALPSMDAAARPAVSARTTDPLRGLDDLQMEQQTMQDLANQTGGRAYMNRNDLDTAMRQAFDDAQVSYVLGYYADHGQWDGKFREIKVKVKRPGIRVRHRTGYFATPDRTETPQEREAALRDAIWSPLDAYGLTLDVSVQPLARAAVRLDVRLEPGPVVFDTAADGRRHATVDVLFAQQSAEGRSLGAVNHTVSMQVTAERHAELLREGMQFSRELPLAAGVVQIRVVARDWRSGAVGSVVVPLSAVLR